MADHKTRTFHDLLEFHLESVHLTLSGDSFVAPLDMGMESTAGGKQRKGVMRWARLKKEKRQRGGYKWIHTL